MPSRATDHRSAAVLSDASASIDGANSQLAILLNSALRRVLGEATFTQVVRDERAQLMARIREQLDREAQAFGIAVVDVRIRRADLPEQNSQAVYQRMQTERQREAAEFRAQGSQRAQEIRARADRDVTVLIADATSKAEQTRGEGDGERNRIFAEAFGRDPDFFAFYRSMQAYEAGLRHNDTRMLLQAGFGVLPLLRRSVAASRATVQPRRGRRRRLRGDQGAARAQAPVACGCVAMSDFLVALGPGVRDRGAAVRGLSGAAKRAWRTSLETPDSVLRIVGIVSAVLGVVLIWLVRG